MRYIQHPSNNDVLGAPAGWTKGDPLCSALPITRATFDGRDGVASYWRPTADELALLNAGGSIELSIIGRSMPPVCLMVAPA